ncbi:hypothetical protein [Aurantiacibacter sediminis]|uniref:Uncharacterized protein n=1 Tax=Aurantiacibacter sediminis TaxID=2793064 RepID=A0ABS0N1D2_9SPHN|nr:hypothetical protein [Aurantiacibacter sediminis]MBH5321537.1 hypothetical protein [Aurantiacibacter sediminis]
MSAEIITIGASLLAILALVALVHFLGFSRGGVLQTDSDAEGFFRLAAGGFAPLDIAINDQRTGALARDANGRLAVLLAHGGSFIARVLGDEASFAWEGKRLSITDQTIGPRSLVLQFDNSAPDWVKGLASAK